MQELSSPKHPRLRAFKDLRDHAAARREARLFVVEGPKLAAEALDRGLAVRDFCVTTAFVAEPQGADLARRLEKAGGRGLRVPEVLFGRLADTLAPQGVMAQVEMASEQGAWPVEGDTLALAACGLQDPGNLGTLMRSACACGAGLVLLSPDCADPWSPKALRAGAGAQLGLRVFTQVDLAREIARLGALGWNTLALDLRGTEDLGLDVSKPSLVLVGAEGPGLPESLSQACTHRVRIAYPGRIESLNAGVAGSLVLFDLLRKRLQNSRK